MDISAVSGKVISATNSIVTITSGSSYTSSTTGMVSNGTGYISGGGGSGSISTSQRNVEKVRIALFDGGEKNVEFNCDPLFSDGNIITLVQANGRQISYVNQTTDRWFWEKIRLPFNLWLASRALWLLAIYLAFQSIFGGFLHWSHSNKILFSVTFSGVIYAALAIAAALFAGRYTRNKKAEIKTAALKLIKEQEAAFQKDIFRSQEIWRQKLADL